MKKFLVTTAVTLVFASGAFAAGCPTVTVADMGGVARGEFPQQYELAEFQAAANCTLSFQGNPDM